MHLIEAANLSNLAGLLQPTTVLSELAKRVARFAKAFSPRKMPYGATVTTTPTAAPFTNSNSKTVIHSKPM